MGFNEKDMVYVDSSDLASVLYDKSTLKLRITFHNGGVYDYSDVPEMVYSGLLNAPSKGIYFAKFIKNVYRFIKVR